MTSLKSCIKQKSYSKVGHKNLQCGKVEKKSNVTALFLSLILHGFKLPVSAISCGWAKSLSVTSGGHPLLLSDAQVTSMAISCGMRAKSSSHCWMTSIYLHCQNQWWEMVVLGLWHRNLIHILSTKLQCNYCSLMCYFIAHQDNWSKQVIWQGGCVSDCKDQRTWGLIASLTCDQWAWDHWLLSVTVWWVGQL